MRIVEVRINPQKVYQKQKFLIQVKCDKLSRPQLPFKIPTNLGGDNNAIKK